ncbi:MAG: hypothetical protein ABR555_16995 [Pyrinomonadaceae bacterium]
MTEPEIARRCKVCGASMRSQALFCHQCGEPIITDQLTAAAGGRKTGELLDAEQEQGATSGSETAEAIPAAAAEQKPARRGRETIERAAHVARAGFEDNVLGRVERIRKVSGVVLDQAAYDPSLRFLLVAAVLLVLVLLLIVLNKVIS